MPGQKRNPAKHGVAVDNLRKGAVQGIGCQRMAQHRTRPRPAPDGDGHAEGIGFRHCLTLRLPLAHGRDHRRAIGGRHKGDRRYRRLRIGGKMRFDPGPQCHDRARIDRLFRGPQQFDRRGEHFGVERPAGGIAVAEQIGRMALFLRPDPLGHGERALRQRIVLPCKHAGRRRQPGDRSIVQR